jgi:hypothetical protein
MKEKFALTVNPDRILEKRYHSPTKSEETSKNIIIFLKLGLFD